MSNVDIVSVVDFAEETAKNPSIICAQVDGRNEEMKIIVFLEGCSVVPFDVGQALKCDYSTDWQEQFRFVLNFCLVS